MHALAVDASGKLHGWGYNGFGQLGMDPRVRDTCATPVAIESGSLASASRIVSIAAGGNFSLAIDASGTLHAVGDNSYGTFGDGTLEPSSAPVAVSGAGSLQGRTVTRIAAGNNIALAIDDEGILHAWGYNNGMGIGDGTTALTSTPVAVSGPSGTGSLLGVARVTAVSAGAAHVLALDASGRVHAWGANGNGGLGNGTTQNSAAPLLVGGPEGFGSLGGPSAPVVVAVAATANSSFALDATGAIHVWGYNGYGQVGDGSLFDAWVPVSAVGVFQT
jgi:alpha-tubulin suppressor-like RCC1 family protein